jgi:hypothetical protein
VEGHVKALWSGMLGILMDVIPWAGGLLHVVCERSEPLVAKSEKEEGEWVHVSAALGNGLQQGV